jgi:hypothetical protein
MPPTSTANQRLIDALSDAATQVQLAVEAAAAPEVQPVSGTVQVQGGATAVGQAAIVDAITALPTPATDGAKDASVLLVRDRLPASGAASETTLVAMNAKIPGDPARASHVQEVRDRLPADGAASEATLFATRSALSEYEETRHADAEREASRALVARYAPQAVRFPPTSIDAQGRAYVNLGASIAIPVYHGINIGTNASGANIAYNAAGSAMNIDKRDQQRALTTANYWAQRARWSIS